MNDRKFVRMQEKGQVTIPQEIRKKLGLKQGDLVAVMETPEGVFITPQQVLAAKAFDRIGDILKEQGLSVDELIASGREIRTDLLNRTGTPADSQRSGRECCPLTQRSGAGRDETKSHQERTLSTSLLHHSCRPLFAVYY
jgi:AbrB family looped-hinge helix DNA binding protein